VFGSGIAKGLITTLGHLAKKPVTVQYPEERLPLPLGYRGRVTLLTDAETGRYKCTACGLCARACPVGIISVTRAKDENGKNVSYPAKYEYNLLECIVCGLCVEACPFEALTMSHERELSVYSRAQADQGLASLAVASTPEGEAQRKRAAGLGQMKSGGDAGPALVPVRGQDR
jgi:NADH-quinone oxidoreductase subunit I